MGLRLLPEMAWTATRRKPFTSPFSLTMATRWTRGTGYSRLLRYTKALPGGKRDGERRHRPRPRVPRRGWWRPPAAGSQVTTEAATALQSKAMRGSQGQRGAGSRFASPAVPSAAGGSASWGGDGDGTAPVPQQAGRRTVVAVTSWRTGAGGAVRQLGGAAEATGSGRGEAGVGEGRGEGGEGGEGPAWGPGASRERGTCPGRRWLEVAGEAAWRGRWHWRRARVPRPVLPGALGSRATPRGEVPPRGREVTAELWGTSSWWLGWGRARGHAVLPVCLASSCCLPQLAGASLPGCELGTDFGPFCPSRSVSSGTPVVEARHALGPALLQHPRALWSGS